MEHSKPYKIPQIEGLITYLQSLDWTEPWIYGLFTFYAFLFGGLYFFRRNSAIQSFSFVLMLLTVYMAEDLNEYCAHNHKKFTKHQYFDSSGLFISVIMSAPLLLASAFVVANWFYVSSQLMTQVKILQLQRRHHQQSVLLKQQQQQQHQPEEDQNDNQEHSSSSSQTNNNKRKKRVKKEQ